MNIVVLVKQVPDTETKIKIGTDGKSIDTSEVKWIMNPYDEYAVEAALRLQDSVGASVTILSMGPERTVESIRTALAMGADTGVLVDDPATEGSDALGKAKVLASALRGLEFDLVLCGHRAVDDDENQVGIMVAELAASTSGPGHIGRARGRQGKNTTSHRGSQSDHGGNTSGVGNLWWSPCSVESKVCVVARDHEGQKETP